MHKCGPDVVAGVQLNQQVTAIEFLAPAGVRGGAATCTAAAAVGDRTDGATAATSTVAVAADTDAAAASALPKAVAALALHDVGGVAVTICDRLTQVVRVEQVDKVLLTVSLGVLQSGAMTFHPPMPPALHAQLGSMGIDAGMKIILQFSERIWPKYMGRYVSATCHLHCVVACTHVLFQFICLFRSCCAPFLRR